VRTANVDSVAYIATFSTFGVRTAVRRGEVLRNTHGTPPARAQRLAPPSARCGSRRPPRTTGHDATAARPQRLVPLIALAAPSGRRGAENGAGSTD
jgi:hypothetical protein